MKHLLFSLLLCLGTACLSAQNTRQADTIVVYDTVKLYLPAPQTPATASSPAAPKTSKDTLAPKPLIDTVAAGAAPVLTPQQTLEATPEEPIPAERSYPEISGKNTETPTSAAAARSNTKRELPAETTDSIAQASTLNQASISIEDSIEGNSVYVNKDLKFFPIYVSLFHPAGMHGLNAKKHRYVFGISPLSITAGSIHGLSVAGLYSHVFHDYYGVQVNGVASVNGGPMGGIQVSGVYGQVGEMNGVQVSGIANLNRGKLIGIQVAGVMNRSGSHSNGVQVAGIANFNGGNTRGLQVSGISNYTRGAMSGIQVSGINNAARGALNGLQVSGILNTAGDVNGVQVAVINKSRKLRGFQLGLLNICDSADGGVSLGLMTIVRKQFYGEIEVAWANYLHAGLQYNMGAKYFHTTYALGMHQPKSSPTYIVHGIGLGSLIRVYKGLHLHPQIMSYVYYAPRALVDFPWYDYQGNTPFVTSSHLKLGIAFYFWDRLGIKITPSVYSTYDYHHYVNSLGDQRLVEPKIDGFKLVGDHVGLGFGLQVGISYKF